MRLRVKKGWHEGGRMATRLGPDVECDGQPWTPVKWDDEEDPDFVKARSMEVTQGLHPEQVEHILDTPVNRQVFMGSGEFAEHEVQRLRNRLEEAFTILSGIQQPPVVTEPAGAADQHEVHVAAGEAEIQAIVREIAVGLTGRSMFS